MCVKNIIRQVLKYLTIGVTGSLVYCCIELLHQGVTFTASAGMGFVAIVVCGLINEGWYNIPILQQAFISGILITIMEYIVGINFNAHHEMWDYTGRFLATDNGQCCIEASLTWCILGVLAIVLDDAIRVAFGEPKKHYIWF